MVLQHHLSPEYVLDKMEMYEVNALLKYAHYSYQDGWEQARLIAYMVAQVNTKKQLKFSDITQFYWENEEEEKNTSISTEDIARLKERAEHYIKNLQENGRNSN